MTNAHHSGNGAADGEVRLSARIDRAVEVLMFNKERYDLYYPDHVLDLTSAELEQIARRKVIQELCEPPCDTEDSSV